MDFDSTTTTTSTTATATTTPQSEKKKHPSLFKALGKEKWHWRERFELKIN